MYEDNSEVRTLYILVQTTSYDDIVLHEQGNNIGSTKSLGIVQLQDARYASVC